jgi:hypothetical protein
MHDHMNVKFISTYLSPTVRFLWDIYPHHDADSIFRPLSQITLFRIYGTVSFYLNAYRVIISLYDTVCCGQQISISVLQEFSLLSCRLAGCYWLQSAVHT